MKSELRRMTEQWMQLERKTLEQRKLAAQFYDDNLMKLIEEDYCERNKDYVFEEVEYLVLSVGTSYEPLVLNIMLLQPKKILFLYTRRSEQVLNKIVHYCGLEVHRFQKKLVDEKDPLTIYREIKASYLEWGAPDKIHIAADRNRFGDAYEKSSRMRRLRRYIKHSARNAAKRLSAEIEE